MIEIEIGVQCPGYISHTVLFNLLIRPPGTAVPEGLMFYSWCIFCFISPQDHWARLADRHDTWPHDRYLAEFYNASPKIWGRSPKKFWAKNMQKLDRFYTTSDFDHKYLCNDPRYPKSESQLIETDSSHVRQNKSSELWSTIHKVVHVSLDPPKLFRQTIFRPLEGASPWNFYTR